MNAHTWFILIYQTLDGDAQSLLATRLKALGGLTVETCHNRGEYFVIVECDGPSPAIDLHELVMTFDPTAVLVDCHGGPVESKSSESSQSSVLA